MTKDMPGHNENLRLAALGIGASALAFVLFGGLGSMGSKGSAEPLDAMPKSSFLVATLDLEELRRSPVYEAAFGKESKDAKAADPFRSALGMESLADACGFDPLGRVQRLAVSLPEEGERGAFGLAARVDVTRDELERCTRAITEKRGQDGAKVEPKQVGSFAVVEGGTGAQKSRLGYGSGGLLVVGKGAWFDAMIGAADHTSPGARDAEEHAKLRTTLTAPPGWKRPTLVATAILPKSLRERLKGEMGAEVGAADPSNASMGGVLGVSAVGVALQAGGPGRATEVAVELVCDTGAACEMVEKLVLKKRLELSKELTIRMVGLGPLIDSVEVKRDGAKLRATASADAAALAGTLERILKLRSAKKQPPLPPIPREPDDPRPPRPDESIPSKRGPM
ncbi:MAG: hypothetical protein JST00_01090 [Deltaproteobacteria bacterium]|nr:hypothetical protein [Deltaproteobacteria bacterium]